VQTVTSTVRHDCRGTLFAGRTVLHRCRATRRHLLAADEGRGVGTLGF